MKQRYNHFIDSYEYPEWGIPHERLYYDNLDETIVKQLCSYKERYQKWFKPVDYDACRWFLQRLIDADTSIIDKCSDKLDHIEMDDEHHILSWLFGSNHDISLVSNDIYATAMLIYHVTTQCVTQEYLRNAESILRSIYNNTSNVNLKLYLSYVFEPWPQPITKQDELCLQIVNIFHEMCSSVVTTNWHRVCRSKVCFMWKSYFDTTTMHSALDYDPEVDYVCYSSDDEDGYSEPVTKKI